MQKKNILRIVVVTAVLLLIPLLGKWPWSLSDFVFAAVLLGGAGLTFEFVASRASHNTYRAASGIAVVAALLLVWINGAVGIIGSEDNPANLFYAGVLITLLIGSTIARLESRGMVRTLYATALVQAAVVVALLVFKPEITSWGPPGVLGIFVLNAVFVMLFVMSALLFRNASPTYPK